ncbi:Uma2 family endonuclease [Luteitalea sp. TBR-22]|uniref:Uma2 family endonuclease n=1 Tax=Luteitalea sp. TBR-22 TaxID=2802971 RepID=UPI001EF6DAE8|nr:Uma2 family endonuclease [Luteitalea sp. TBR-22]
MPRIELGRSATYADLIALPDHVVGEIVDDQLWTAPRPSPRHAWAAGQLMAELGSRLRGDGSSRAGGWRILPEPELHFGRQVVVPDLAGWRREHMPRLPDVAYIEATPDWVCEVLSPSTERLDRDRKLWVYGSAGVGHVWLVDPLAESLEVLRRVGGSWTHVATHVGRDVAREEPFDALDLHLALLWDDQEP